MLGLGLGDAKAKANAKAKAKGEGQVGYGAEKGRFPKWPREGGRGMKWKMLLISCVCPLILKYAQCKPQFQPISSLAAILCRRWSRLHDGLVLSTTCFCCVPSLCCMRNVANEQRLVQFGSCPY